jgi:hypothetical protein
MGTVAGLPAAKFQLVDKRLLNSCHEDWFWKLVEDDNAL